MTSAEPGLCTRKARTELLLQRERVALLPSELPPPLKAGGRAAGLNRRGHQVRRVRMELDSERSVLSAVGAHGAGGPYRTVAAQSDALVEIQLTRAGKQRDPICSTRRPRNSLHARTPCDELHTRDAAV